MRFLDHTQQRTTGGRTLLDEWSARCRDFYLTKHNTHKRDIHAPSGIWTHQSQQASTHRPCHHWDWHCTATLQYIYIYTHTHTHTVCIYIYTHTHTHRYMNRSFRVLQICHYLMWVIWTATDNPLFHPITPSCTRESPIAAKPTRGTTWNQILCWKVEVLCAIWMYANPVWHGFHSTKCLEDTHTEI